MHDLKVLIVEDEMIASEYLKEVLLSFGITRISLSKNAANALEIVQNESIDLVFMDINIEGGVDGISCAKEIHLSAPVPIVYTTAYKDSHTIQEASATNIYGYLMKPFREEEVLVTLNILHKRIKEQKQHQEPEKELINLNGYLYNTKTKTISKNNTAIKLTLKEEHILSILIANINNNIPYALLKEQVWKDKEISSSTLRDTVSRLRKKLPLLPLENISNYGYILKK